MYDASPCGINSGDGSKIEGQNFSLRHCAIIAHARKFTDGEMSVFINYRAFRAHAAQRRRAPAKIGEVPFGFRTAFHRVRGANNFCQFHQRRYSTLALLRRTHELPRCVAESECAHATYVVHPQQVIHFSEGHALACLTGSTPYGMIARNNFAPPTIRLGVRNGKMKNRIPASRGLVKISLPRPRQVGGSFKYVAFFFACLTPKKLWCFPASL